MKEAIPGHLHYIFLQAHVNEPIVSISEYFRKVPGFDRPRQIWLESPPGRFSSICYGLFFAVAHQRP